MMLTGKSQRSEYLRYLAQTNDIPLLLEIEKAQGSWLYDRNGKRYLDLISGISVSSLGHQHPRVLQAIRDQTERHLHLMVYGEFIQSPQIDYARFLCERLPENLNSVYFTNSGTEATEGAMKLAKRHTGRRRILAFQQAYHGSTQGALSLAGESWLKGAYEPLIPETALLRYDDMASLDAIDDRCAAIFLECVRAEAGTRLPSPEFLKALRQKCRETSTLLVVDEIQTGFGRTGSWFASETMGIVPDIILLGKALGGGLPLGAFIASKEMMAGLAENPVLGHITTFGGHPLSCAAGFAAAQVIEEEKLPERALQIEAHFREALDGQEIHGRGALLSIQFANQEFLKKVIDRSIENGLITDWFLFNPESLRIAPPLNISEDELRFATDVLNEAIHYANAH